MAKVFGPLLSMKATGKISPGMVFKCTRRGTQFSKYQEEINSRPVDNAESLKERSPEFVEQQSDFKEAAAYVKAMSPEDKALWEEKAKVVETHYTCTGTVSGATYPSFAISFIMISLKKDAPIPSVPEEIRSDVQEEWDNIQLEKRLASRGWQTTKTL